MMRSDYDGEYPAPGYVTTEQLSKISGLSLPSLNRRLKSSIYDPAFFIDARKRYHINADMFLDLESRYATKKQTEMKNIMPKVATSTGEQKEQKNDTYVQARTGNELAKLKIQKLKIDELEGKLISADKARADSFLFARSIRDQLLSIPDRVSAILAAEKDERKVYLRLQEEIKLALKETANILVCLS